jgi:hypothetical protein
VTTFAFHIPVPDDDAPVTIADVSDLCAVIDDDDARGVTKSLLYSLLAITDRLSMAGIAEVFHEISPEQRRALLDHHRKSAGLPGVEEALAEERMDQPRIADTRHHVIALSPAGVPIDVTLAADEAERQAEQARGRAKLKEAREAERLVAAEERRAGQRALRERDQREAIPGLRP